MGRINRVLTAARNMTTEWRACIRESSGFRSGFQLCQDFALSRVLTYLPERMRNEVREIELRNGVKLLYRLNRGDVQSMREIWLEDAYRLPFPISNSVLVDLGANIGFTSIWLAKKYGFARVIAVEPNAANAELVRKNFALNGIAGTVVEAAVGPEDGTAKFRAAAESNMGRLSDEGDDEVTVVSMKSLFERFQLTDIDLVKLDIEGGEQALLTGPGEWLYHTRALIAEFHPDMIDYPGLTQLLEQRGFRYVRANTAFPNNMDSFYRPEKGAALGALQ